MNEAILIHHGIKGQKWGVRRFQNEDGSLTSAGKKRRSESEEKSTSNKTKVAKTIAVSAAVGVGIATASAAAIKGKNLVGEMLARGYARMTLRQLGKNMESAHPRTKSSFKKAKTPSNDRTTLGFRLGSAVYNVMYRNH